MFGLLGLGVRVSLVSNLLRSLFFGVDSLIYMLIPEVYSVIEKLYDLTSLMTSASTVINTFSKTIYGFLAIFMFFKLAFSLLEMLVDPSKIDDKQKGAGKIVTGIMITLILIVAIPKIFETSRTIQTKVIDEKLIEKVFSKDFGENCTDDYCINLGDKLSKSIFSVFFRASSTIGSDGNIINAWNGFFNDDNIKMSGIGVMDQYVNEKTNGNTGFLESIPGVGSIVGGIKSWITGSHYDISYIYILSTVVGVYLLWTIVKFAIDVAFRSLKLFALELIAPIPIMTYIDPKSSSKDGIFSKWVSESIKTYISLFIRIFVLAFVSVLLSSVELPKDDGMFSGNGATILIYILAVISFIKVAPKFIDGIFGTTLSKDSDTKFGSDLLKSALGAGTSAAIGGISGAVIAGRTKNGVGRGAWEGIKKGFSGGWNAGKKGGVEGMIGVVKSGSSGAEAAGKYFGVDYGATMRKKERTRTSAIGISDHYEELKNSQDIGAGRKDGWKNDDGTINSAATRMARGQRTSTFISQYGFKGKSAEYISSLQNLTSEEMNDTGLMVERAKVFDAAISNQQLVKEGHITQEQADLLTHETARKFNKLLYTKRLDAAESRRDRSINDSTLSIQDLLQLNIENDTRMQTVLSGGKVTLQNGTVIDGSTQDGADLMREQITIESSEILNQQIMSDTRMQTVLSGGKVTLQNGTVIDGSTQDGADLMREQIMIENNAVFEQQLKQQLKDKIQVGVRDAGTNKAKADSSLGKAENALKQELERSNAGVEYIKGRQLGDKYRGR